MFNNQDGIALGPILFIIAILAIIAAAIAAGSASFNANKSNESSKAMAEVIINSGHAYVDALNLMFGNGCDVTLLDYTPDGGAWPAGATYTGPSDFTGGNGTGHTGNGTCALFDTRGGGMMFKQLPAIALATPATGAYTSASDGGVNEDAYAGYPILAVQRCFAGQGTCSLTNGNNNNSALYLVYNYVSYSVCKEINILTGSNFDPNLYYDHMLQLNNTVLNGINLTTNGYTGTNTQVFGVIGNTGLSTTLQYLEGCSYDVYSNSSNSAYIYTIALMIR